jgi:hypothetical protein
MSLYQNSISPDALFRSQLRSTVKAVHQQFSSTFLEVQQIVGKLCNDVPLTREKSHKVDLYRTVCNACRVQQWNHDISSSAPFNNTDTIVKHHDSTTTRQVQLHDSVSHKRNLMPNHDEVALMPTRKSPRLKLINQTVTAAEQLSPHNVNELYHHAPEAGEEVLHASEDGEEVLHSSGAREDVLHECTPQSLGIRSTCQKRINPTTTGTIDLSGEGGEEVSHVDESLASAAERDNDYSTSTHSSDDNYLDSDIETESDDDSESGDYQYQLLCYRKEAFYEAFTPYYESVKSSSKLITNENYDRILGIVSAPKEKKESAVIIKYRRLYSIVGNVEKRCLYRQNKVVTTFENLFDVILEAHNQISHARSTKSHLLCIKNTLECYGVTFNTVKMFVQTCPLVGVFIFACVCFFLE